jgi:hypothetical protein
VHCEHDALVKPATVIRACVGFAPVQWQRAELLDNSLIALALLSSPPQQQAFGTKATGTISHTAAQTSDRGAIAAAMRQAANKSISLIFVTR